MAFTLDMKQAANRHLAAANTLDEGGKRPVAAYLYGLAAECAVKALLKALKTPEPRDKTGPYYAHFPELRGLLADAIQGRGAHVLEPFTKNSFLSDWDIVVRYAKTDEIVGESDGRDARYRRWQDNAKVAVSTMEESV